MLDMTSMVSLSSSLMLGVPFAWEAKPGIPNPFYKFDEQDFEFDVNVEFGSDLVLADDLFDDGVIKSLEMKTGSSSFSSFGGLPSSRTRTRTRTHSFSSHRGWEVPWEEREREESEKQKTIKPKPKPKPKPQLASSFPTLSASSSVKESRKWSFKSLLLFRSASDGRAMERDPLKKYWGNSAVFKKHDEDLRSSSARTIEPHGSGSGSKRRGAVSAHEVHYKVNRAVANEMKKKSFLPYKQGLLGRSAVNTAAHAVSNGFGVSLHNRE